MEINRQLGMLAILVAALFLVASSWSSTALAATQTETQTKVTKKKVARNAKGSANLIEPRIAQAQPANVSGHAVPIAYPVCVPCASGPGTLGTYRLPLVQVQRRARAGLLSHSGRPERMEQLSKVPHKQRRFQ